MDQSLNQQSASNLPIANNPQITVPNNNSPTTSWATNVPLIAGIVHSLFTAFYLFIAFRLGALYRGIGIKPPVLNNWPLIIFFIFAVINFSFWIVLRKKNKSGVKVSYGLIVSIILLIAPFLIFYGIGVYANLQMAKALKATDLR